MKNSWKEVLIGDIGKVVTGNTPPKNDPLNYGGKYPFIKPTDMTKDQRYVFEYEETYSEKAFKRFKNAYIPPFSTGVVTIGTVGEKLFLSHEWCFTNQSVNVIIPHEDKYDKMFVYYLMKYNLPKVSKANPGTASGRHHVSKSNFCSIQVEVPPLSIQQKIASILSTYDDLIENNNRRIAILEEMARSLYREWFVKFRFPGYEAVKMVDSELGQIPDGWEVKHLENVIDINRGRSYKSSELVEEGGLPFLNLKNIARDGGFRRDGLKWYNGPYKPAQTACANDIIMAVTDMTQERAVIARPARVPNMGFDMFVLSMDLIKITAKLDYDNGFVYCLLRYSQFSDEVKQFANGANVLHLSPTVIEKYQTILPPMELQTKFYTIVQKLHRLQDNLAIKNDNLKTQRDMLLPKLISGKIEV